MAKKAKTAAAAAAADLHQPFEAQVEAEDASATGEFPKMLYKPNGEQRIVKNRAEQQKAAKQGFKDDPPED